MSSEYVLPTKIFLLELRKKLRLVDFSKRILEKKRDSLQSAIKKTIEEMKEVILFLKRELIELMKFVLATAIVYGRSLRIYALIQKGKLKISVRYISERGILVPVFEVEEFPELKDRFPEGIRALAKKLKLSIPDILRLASIFVKIELLLRELEVTNRIVNTLDKVVIPSLKEKISYVLSMLSEFFIAELSSLRVLITGVGEGL